MSDNLPIYEGKRANFASLVLENSFKGPVFVYYWTEKAGPCHKFFPVLTKLVKAWQGRFLLVTINTANEPSLCHQQKVSSVPTLHLFHQGEKVREWHGPQSEADLQQVLNHYLGMDSDQLLIDALALYKKGDIDEGLSMMARAAMDNPENFRIAVTLAKLLMAQRRHDEAKNLLEGLPDSIKKQKEVAVLLAHQHFIQIAKTAPDYDVLHQKMEQGELSADERFQYAGLCLLHDQYEMALRQLFILLEKDRSEKIQRGIMAIFDILGEDNPLVFKYRSALFKVLY